MNGVSDGIAKENKEREREEMQREESAKRLEERLNKERMDLVKKETARANVGAKESIKGSVQ
jgi:hypothetical protein